MIISYRMNSVQSKFPNSLANQPISIYWINQIIFTKKIFVVNQPDAKPQNIFHENMVYSISSVIKEK